MAPNAGNFWESLDGFGLFLYIHSIIFVVNYKMNIISSHKMFIISPSVTRAAVRGWFWVSGCSSDMSRCIHWDWYWYPGDCLRSLGQLRHRFATYYGSRISQTSGSDLGSRVFEAPFASLVVIVIIRSASPHPGWNGSQTPRGGNTGARPAGGGGG